MFESKVVEVDNLEIQIPLEVFTYLHSPKLLELRVTANDDKFVINRGIQRFGSLRQQIKKLMPSNNSCWANLVGLSATFAKYRLSDVDSDFFDNIKCFNVVNYQDLLLMPSNHQELVSGRNKFWSQIENYHEHRSIADQDDSAQNVSSWLVSTIEKLNPESLLEIGCGAGRNLITFKRALPQLRLSGIEINSMAVEKANSLLESSQMVLKGDLYSSLSEMDDGCFDIILTCGVLMHVPHTHIVDLVRHMYRVAKIAVVNFELHGPSHFFDFHRYPRDYRQIYLMSGITDGISYSIYPRNDFRSSGTNSFNHAMLVAHKS